MKTYSDDKEKEIKRLRQVFVKLAKMMRHYEVPVEMGKIILEEAGKKLC
jgi:hypothetical protein